MVFKNLLNRTAKWTRSLSHFGRLGRVAATRAFLTREKKKLLLKLGERAFELFDEKKISSDALSRLVGQIEKINGLLEKQDYGGGEGIDFHRHKKKSKLQSPRSKA